MFSSSECRVQAAEKIAQAEREPQNQERLRTAAEAWLVLANQIRRIEASIRRTGKIRSKSGQVS